MLRGASCMNRKTIIIFFCLFFLLGCTLKKEIIVNASVSEATFEENIDAIQIIDVDTLEYNDKEGKVSTIDFQPTFKTTDMDLSPYLVSWTTTLADKQEFGYNLSIPNDATGDAIVAELKTIDFPITSDAPLEVYGVGVRYPLRTVQDSPFLSHTEYEVFDYSDLAQALTYPVPEIDEETGKLTGNILQQPVPYTVTITKTGAIISFDLGKMQLSKGQLLVLDPTISIVNVANYTSTTVNVTTEAHPFSHITVNDSSMLGYWNFDMNWTLTATNITYDLTSNNNDATLQGNQNATVWNQTGIVGGGRSNLLTINGTSDYFDAGNSSILNNPASTNRITIMVWATTRGSTVSQYFLTKNVNSTCEQYGFRLQGSSTPNLRFFACNSSNNNQQTTTTGNFMLLNNTWYHEAVVWNGTHLAFYENGILNQNLSTGIKLQNYSGSVKIGAAGAGATIAFNGTMDELMLFDRALTQQEISSYYNMTAARFAGPPAIQLFENISIGQDGTINALNVTTNTSLLNGTAMNLTILELNSNGVNYQNQTPGIIVTGDNQVLPFNISDNTYNVSLLFRFISNIFNSYSPVLKDTIAIVSFETLHNISWSNNLTNSTLANTLIMHSVLWNSSLNLSGYTFYFNNGTNYTTVGSSVDVELSTNTFLAMQNLTYHRMNSSLNLTSAKSFNNTPNTTGTQPLSWNDGFAGMSEVSNSCYANMSQSDNISCYIRGNSNADVYLSTRYNLTVQSINDILWMSGTLKMNKNSSAAGEDCAYVFANFSSSTWERFNQTDAAGPSLASSFNYTTNLSANLVNTSDMTVFIATHGLDADLNIEGCDIDFSQLEIYFNGTAIENTTDYTVYNDTVTTSGNFTNITVKINVSTYNSSQSILNKNQNVSIDVDLYNGSAWINIGNVTPTAGGLFNLSTINVSVLVAWQNLSNTDIRIRMLNIDFNSSLKLDKVVIDNITVVVNITQKFIPDPFTTFTSGNCTTPFTLCYSNITRTAPNTVSTFLQWYVFANSSANSFNTTSVFSYNTTAASGENNTCTYTSGNWAITCSDSCNITNATNLLGNNITATGAGTIKVTATISNFTKVIVTQGCRVIVNTGGKLTRT